MMRKMVLIGVLFFTACSKAEKTIEQTIVEEKGQQEKESAVSIIEADDLTDGFSILSYVDRADIQKHRVRLVHQSIKRAPDSESGINYSFYFDENGRLEASSPGYSSSTYYNFFDDQGRLEYTGWAFEHGAPIDEKRRVELVEFMPWETAKRQSSHKVGIFNTCYSVSAEYLYHPNATSSGELPTGGHLELVREVPMEDIPNASSMGSPEKLLATFKYEFYQD